jgi:hypothetical protein
MVKINLMRLAAFVVICLFVMGTSNAQTKVWGVGSGTGVADAEFSTTFTQSGTAGSYGATVWTALSVNQGGGAVTPGSAYWTRSLTGYSAGAYWGGTTPMASPSQVNGVAIFDSDFMDNAGVQNAFGTGTSPSPHKGELISPRIDLTGYTDSALVIQFFARYREYSINELSIAVSVDDGVTWAQTVDFRSVFAADQEGLARVLLATATSGASNLTQCRLKFTFDGDYYFVIVDDVTIEVAPLYDISMGSPNPSGTLLIDAGDNVKIGGNAYNPAINIDPTDLREWFWGGKAANFGALTLYPADSAAMYVNIDFTDAITGGVTPSVYMDTIWYDTLHAGDGSGVTNIEYLRDLSFISTYGEGEYSVSYWVAHKNTDGTTANDTAKHNFTITGSTPLTNYLSKARIASADGKVYAARGIFPGGGPFSHLSMVLFIISLKELQIV